jgi:Tol biopolymer transport system component
VSHAPDGTPAGVLQDDTPALSADGRFVAFTSTRSDLAGEPGGAVNVYLWDRENGAVTLAGASQRVGIPFPLRHPALSADGRWLVFLSNAETPAPGFDNPGHANQVVLFDRVTGARTLLTPSALVPGQADQMGAALPAITPDARWIAFQVFGAGLYLYDRLAGTASLVAATQGSALLLSDDGREIALESPLSNLVPRDFNGVRRDVFLFSGARP